MTIFKDKVAGVLYGVAYGDALGATIEKLTHNQIKDQYGEIRSIHHKWYKEDWKPADRNNRMRGNGIITDDTLMTIALIDSYTKLRRHIDAYDMGESFVEEIVYTTRFIPELNKMGTIQERLFYPEQYIYMRHILANCDPREGGYGNMVNCGAAMYIAPIGVVNAGNPKGAYDEAILFASGHQVSYGLEAAGILAACIAEAFRIEATVDSIIAVALEYGKDGTKNAIETLTNLAESLRLQRLDKTFIVEQFHQAILPFSPMADDVHRKKEKLGMPSNHYTPSRLFTIEELPLALAYLKLYEDDFEEGMISGVNSGRDTDSIGVMFGAICGALVGNRLVSIEDQELLTQVNQIDFENYIDSLSDVAFEIITADIEMNQKRARLLN